jgi:hypothetical protein
MQLFIVMPKNNMINTWKYEMHSFLHNFICTLVNKICQGLNCIGLLFKCQKVYTNIHKKT